MCFPENSKQVQFRNLPQRKVVAARDLGSLHTAVHWQGPRLTKSDFAMASMGSGNQAAGPLLAAIRAGNVEIADKLVNSINANSTDKVREVLG